jgi:hypothetical protein
MASSMIESPLSVSLRMQDALLLTIANDIPVTVIATADRIMDQSARLLKFEAVLFGER